ncbi:hypothetical protein POSPLADRAFT_1133133 [Postia placenta MAD-698-R-SB12]|uniref:YDG domain-containing protein n=1 Tax=Postia placenta MAD-698-R-SB12 TaxID=670580 RepID=A0A1X6NB99_9APHY|nr:hypothetical protein POSPLADRAFT_1133133 [Postia placenta MAD-698-R-SB12]OSX65716.1 hypothetical protein POSPLADRAFT_1133133 [Postia placenta MAD-698-R-SB12]
MDCLRAGVHRATRAGIHGSQIHGTYSIVISGGYQDDYDKGETIIYTGAGGQDVSTNERTHMQTSDQRLDHPHNAALVVSAFGHRRKVRVIRGSKLGSKFAPGTMFVFYRYDGLYTVTHVSVHYIAALIHHRADLVWACSSSRGKVYTDSTYVSSSSR